MAETLPTRVLWAVMDEGETGKNQLKGWAKTIRDMAIMNTLKMQTRGKEKNQEGEEGVEGVQVEDDTDWMDADWTEITAADLDAEGNSGSVSHQEIQEAVLPLLEIKLDCFKEEVEQVITGYFDENVKKQKKSKVDQFIDILSESEELETKIKEEKDDNQRLMDRLNNLDSELSTLLVNQIGNTISLECDYVDAKTNLLKEKTNDSLNRSKVIQNEAESLLYNDKNKNVALKVRDLLQRKIQDNKKDKERLSKELLEYRENRIHLKPLVHQYSEILKNTREIDRQVSQLMKY